MAQAVEIQPLTANHPGDAAIPAMAVVVINLGPASTTGELSCSLVRNDQTWLAVSLTSPIPWYWRFLI